MKIVSAKVHELCIPVESGGPHGWGSEEWKALDFVLLEVATDSGLTGWGEGWAYDDREATATALRSIIVPQIIGREVTDVAGFTAELLRDNREVAASPFAIGAVDIALWDLAGKVAGVPLHRLLGGAKHDRLSVIASLFCFEDPRIVKEMCLCALADDIRCIKLHEHQEECVRAAREVAPDVELILDVYCQWTVQEAVKMAQALRPYDLLWLEEPIHPPEDIDSLSLLKPAGIPIALGENVHSIDEFQRIIDPGTVDIIQPGITKLGGINEVQKVLKLAAARGVKAIPWNPHLGPGLLAYLHLIATSPEPNPVEYFYYKSIEGQIYGDAVMPKGGYLSVPQTPGLGYEPDVEVLERFAV